jgi:multisubunit Na+/H+ antiporter MnhB subunit
LAFINRGLHVSGLENVSNGIEIEYLGIYVVVVGAVGSTAAVLVAMSPSLAISGTSEMRTDFLRFAVVLSVAGTSAGAAGSVLLGRGALVAACTSVVPA